ncbi:MAG: metallophosphoesterase [Melioribacteraceae bacterium]|nr:metallophosphoesterase [Melioribacteraceae bacterium]
MLIDKLKSLLLVVLFLTVTITAQTVNLPGESVVPKDVEKLAAFDGHFTFMMASDLGRNGYYEQKPVAEMMGVVTKVSDLEFVAAIGDVHHFLGVKSVDDPLWETNFEWIYKHPELMIPWYPVLGNHEYEGNTQAVVDYTNVSRRWIMPAKYYSKTFRATDNTEVLILWIDTPSLIDKYRNNPEEYPDGGKLSIEEQLEWLETTLRESDAKWKIAMGHHPVYAGTYKDDIERTDLQKRLQPLLDKYNVDFAVSGHIHNFQHLQVEGSNVDYFVNTSASQTREIDEKHIAEGQIFTSSDSGFSLCTVKDNELIISFVNKEGEIIYQYSRTK